MEYITNHVCLHLSHVNFGTINMNKKKHIIHLVLEQARERRLIHEPQAWKLNCILNAASLRLHLILLQRPK